MAIPLLQLLWKIFGIICDLFLSFQSILDPTDLATEMSVSALFIKWKLGNDRIIQPTKIGLITTCVAIKNDVVG